MSDADRFRRGIDSVQMVCLQVQRSRLGRQVIRMPYVNRARFVAVGRNWDGDARYSHRVIGARTAAVKPRGLILGLALALIAGYGADSRSQGFVRPGALTTIAGTTSQWKLPTPQAPRDPMVDAEGNVYVAIANGDRIARFDPKSALFKEWALPAGTNPHGVVATSDGKVLFGGKNSGTVGELDPRGGSLRQFGIPTAGSGPYSLTLDGEGNVWLTERGAGKLAKFDRATNVFSEVPMDGEPYGLIVDPRGVVWVTRIAADTVSRYEPKTGKITDLFTGRGSKPRRLSVAPDGMLWVSLYGIGKLLKIDPVTMTKVQEYSLPGGPNCGPYSVNADARGRIWVSEYQTDAVSILDPRLGTFRTVRLPEKNSGVRNAVIDAQGRYWYVGATTGKLGMIE